MMATTMRLSKLWHWLIAREPLVWLVPASWQPKQRALGMDAGKSFWIADDFDDPLPPEIPKYFE